MVRRLGHSHAVDLAPEETTNVGGVSIHAASATHRGNRYGYDRWRSAANMYLIDDAKRDTLFFAGDTALVEDTHRMVERVLWDTTRARPRAATIGYAPWWKPGFRKGHLTHDDALTLFETLRARSLCHITGVRFVTSRRRRTTHHRITGATRVAPSEFGGSNRRTRRIARRDRRLRAQYWRIDASRHPLDLSETIVAQATVPGRGALAIVRLSGPTPTRSRNAPSTAGRTRPERGTRRGAQC